MSLALKARAVVLGTSWCSAFGAAVCYVSAARSMHSFGLSSCKGLSSTSSAGHSQTSRAGLARRACLHLADRLLANRPILMDSCTMQRALHTSNIGDAHHVSSEFLSLEELSPDTHLHLVVLNYVLPQQMARLWERATTRICADGGANRLYDQIPDMVPGVDPTTARQQHMPDLIKGDMDSVRPEVQDFYTSRGVPLIDLSSDQDTTDLEKCLLFLDGRVRTISQEQAAAKQHHNGRTPVLVRPVSRGYSTAALGARQQQQQLPGLVPVSMRSVSSCDSLQAMMEVDCSTPSTAAPPAVPCSDVGSVHSSSMRSSQSEQPVLGEILMLVDPTETPQQPEQQHHQQHQQPPWQQRQQWQQTVIAGRPGSSSSNGRGLSAIAGSLQEQSNGSHAEHLILVLGALGGRLDHTLANLNTLYCYPHLNIILWGDGNLVRLLRAGRNIVKPSKLEGPTCGLVPLAQPATASSKGLKWDLDNYYMCFRGQLSTSNVIASDTIDVTTDEDLLWITAIGDD